MSDVSKWMSKLTKDFGILAEDVPSPSTNVIKMPSPSLNWAVGNGGLVVGKSMLLFGPESGGKSLLQQLILAQVQKDNPDGICILFDAEFSFNPEWFKKLGGDPKRLIVRQSNDPKMIFDYIWGDMLELLQDGCPIKAIGIDSVKSILYPKDIKEDSTKQTMGGSGAPYLGPTLKRILPIIRQYNITAILVQQVYEEMDEMRKMNNPYIVPDGRSLKHFCDYMLQVDKLETKAGRIEMGENIHGGSQQVGHKVRIKCKKNRTGAPYRTAQFSLDYNHGIVDVGNEVFDLGVSLGVIGHPTNEDTGKTNAQMWKFGKYDEIRGQDNARLWLCNNSKVQEEILTACNDASNDANSLRNEKMKEDGVDIDIEDL